ncbi:MAG: hypothetical protein QOG13_2696 [Sphingomonadales bacterium]|jgi:hypothetical protein|nr:hypothetical protein [Sphingomonadales bacterium]
MTIARNLLAASLAIAAAAPLAAQKPGAALDPDRERWRGQGISHCIAELGGVEGITADDQEAICGCALDRFMPNVPTGALPPLGPGRVRTVLSGPILSCTAQEQPRLAAAVSRWLVQAAATPPPLIEAAPPPAGPEEGGKPVDLSDDSPPAPDRPGFDFRAWVNGLGLPAWLTNSGLPLWALIPLIVFVLLFLRGLMRRRDGKDLIGPPRSLDPTTRRPDLPPPRL